MNEEKQMFTRWVDPTIDDFKIALEEANKQIEEDNEEIERLNKELTIRIQNSQYLVKQKDELEEELERLTKNLKQGIDYCKELMLFKKNSRQYLIGKCMLEKLGGANIWLEEKFNVGVDKE